MPVYLWMRSSGDEETANKILKYQPIILLTPGKGLNSEPRPFSRLTIENERWEPYGLIVSPFTKIIIDTCFFSFLVSDKPEDEDTEVMKNLMDDIQSGFVQRRLPDGGFKVSSWPEKNKKNKRIHLELPRFNCVSFFEGNGNGKKGSRIIFD